jgi:hypothetical protein
MAANPLVRQLGLQQLLERDAPTPPESQDLAGAQLESALAGHVRLAWSRNKLSKFRIDEKLLQDLRARRGVYSPTELATMQSSNGGANIVYAPLTETKCRAASAWIREIVLPVGEQPWGVDPSPQPNLPMPMKQAVVAGALKQAQQAMQQAQAAGGGVMDKNEFKDLVLQIGDKLKDDAEKTYLKLAKDRALRMEAVIGDRLEDGDYQAAMDGFIEDFVTYPAAVLKGPIYTRRKQLTWTDNWTPKVEDKAIQTWARVSPFDCYPAAASTSPQKGDFIERMRFRRDELYAFKGMDGWKDDQIDGALRDYTNGHIEAWLWTESERQRLEQETTWMWLSPPGVIDALNFWGSVPGWKLMSWGLEGLNPTQDYECNVVLCGRYVLYATLNPNAMGTRPYRKACYDEVPGAFWGRSIPDLMRACQQFCNAAACALADNLSIASGPQTWVHADRFADGEQSMEMFPWKLWQLKSDPTQGVNPGIGFFQPDDRSGPLMAVYEKWKGEADDATGIPRYTYGNDATGGSADTASGLSMLMNNAAKGLRRAIGNIDLNVIAPTINDTFYNEMVYNPDHSIKGDCIVVPRGAAAVLVRESHQAKRLQFMQLTANPIDAPIIGAKHRAALLREVALSLDLPVDDVVPSDDEIQQNMVMMQQQAAQQQQAEANMQAQKEAAIAQRENSAQQTRSLGDIVKTSIASAAQAKNDTPDSQGATP